MTDAPDDFNVEAEYKKHQARWRRIEKQIAADEARPRTREENISECEAALEHDRKWAEVLRNPKRTLRDMLETF
jgi:hypothetical protein